MVYEASKQAVAWMEHELQISLKDTHFQWKKMAAGAVGRAMNYGLDGQETNIYSESSNFSILTS